MVDQYNVAIIDKEGQAWEKIAMYAQRIMPYDESGNANRWAFSRENLPYVGEVLVLKTLNRDTADLVHEEFDGLEGVVTLEPTVSEWEK